MDKETSRKERVYSVSVRKEEKRSSHRRIGEAE